MATKLKPIETMYNGYRFRSRLEARWAVFFDALGVEYEYEKEGYDLGEAGWYLPDFWLPQVDMWAEVKPGALTIDEERKIDALVDGTGYVCLLLCGTPENKPYSSISNHGVFGGNHYLTMYKNYPIDAHRFYVDWSPLSDFINIDGTKGPRKFADTERAVIAARSARFEFGDAVT